MSCQESMRWGSLPGLRHGCMSIACSGGGLEAARPHRDKIDRV
jgi:hypothetical protein